MEKKQPSSPFDVLGPNSDIYRCNVQEESIIRLVNQTTGDKWDCHVTSSNISSFRSKKCTGLRLRGLRHVAIAILQEVLNGNIGPMVSSYATNEDWYTLSLRQKHSKYFMKLRLTCQIDGMKGTWSFPMNPDDPGAIEKRDEGSGKRVRESTTLPQEASASPAAQKRAKSTRQSALRSSKTVSLPPMSTSDQGNISSTTQKSVDKLQELNGQQQCRASPETA